MKHRNHKSPDKFRQTKRKKEFKKKKRKKKVEEEESRRTQGVPLRSRSIIFANLMEINRLVRQIKKEQSIALPDH